MQRTLSGKFQASIGRPSSNSLDVSSFQKFQTSIGRPSSNYLDVSSFQIGIPRFYTSLQPVTNNPGVVSSFEVGDPRVPDITLVHNFPVIAVIAPGYYRLWSIIILGISFVITVPELFSRWVMELAKWNCQCQQSDNNSRSIQRASKCTNDSIAFHIQSFSLIFGWDNQHPAGANTADPWSRHPVYSGIELTVISRNGDT